MAYELPVPNKINDIEYMYRLDNLYSKYPNETDITISDVDSTEMFTLYNDKIIPRESSYHCSGCRLRVYRRLKIHYEYLKNKSQDINGTEEK